MKKTLLVIAVLALAATGCYKDNAQDMYPGTNTGNCDTAGVTYATMVKPLIDSKCATAGCHVGSTVPGYDFSNYTGVAAVASSGKLVAAINHTGPNPMPLGSAKLDDCTITKITKWVNDGAPNN